MSNYGGNEYHKEVQGGNRTHRQLSPKLKDELVMEECQERGKNESLGLEGAEPTGRHRSQNGEDSCKGESHLGEVSLQGRQGLLKILNFILQCQLIGKRL